MRCTKDKTIKVDMIQVPRAIQEVPGFIPARTARLGEPRSTIRNKVPMMMAGKAPIQPKL